MHRKFLPWSAALLGSLLLFAGCGGDSAAPDASISAPATPDSPVATESPAPQAPTISNGGKTATTPSPSKPTQEQIPASRYSAGNSGDAARATAAQYPSFAQRSASVRIKTTAGDIVVKLHPQKAPLTVDNFLRNYVGDAFYDKTIIHYADKGLIAAGGFNEALEDKPTRAPIRCEANNGLKNVRGTIAMARDPERIDSATSQFFFNVTDNPGFDYRGETPEDYGYCVFGEVVEGMAVLDKISQAPTHNVKDLTNVPQQAIVVESVEVIR